jgi:hypothetical protein
MFRFGRHAFAKLWMAGDLKTLIICHTTIVIADVAESIYTLCHPCVLSKDLHSEICVTPFTTILVVQCVKVGIMYCALSWGIFKSVWAPEIFSRYLGMNFSGNVFPMSEETETCAVVSRNWAAAASCDVFEDTVQVSALLPANPSPAPPTNTMLIMQILIIIILIISQLTRPHGEDR